MPNVNGNDGISKITAEHVCFRNEDPAKITAQDVVYTGTENVSLRVVITLTRANGDEVARAESRRDSYSCSSEDPVSLKSFAGEQLLFDDATEPFRRARGIHL